jgi:hypothetical protein
MANCSYCGQPAGFLRRKHGKCEEAYQEGWTRMVALASDAAVGKAPIENLKTQLQKIATSTFNPESNIHDALIQGWERAADHFLDDGHLEKDRVPPRGVAGGISRRAVRHSRADQRATAGRLMRGSSLNWPTLSSVM